MTSERTYAHRALDVLRDAGVEVIFTCPGTTEVPLLDASVQRPGLRFVLATHEAAAVSMADGYARATGGTGAALLHANVGLCNGLSMAEAARIGRSPVLVLNGTKPTGLRNRRTFTSTPESAAVARPFTVGAMDVGSPASLTTDLASALAMAQGPPSGPVYLSLPQDLLAMPAEHAGTRPCPRPVRPATAAASSALDEAARQLSSARRVLVVAGGDLTRRDGVVPLEELAALLPAPVFEPPWRDLERETVHTGADRYCGLLSDAGELLHDTVILLAGAPVFQEPDDGTPLLAPTARVIHAAEPGTELRPGATALVGDPRETLVELARRVRELRTCQENAELVADREEFLRTARESHRLRQAALLGGEPTSGDHGRIATLALCGQLRRLAGTGPVVLDAVTATATLLRLLPRGERPFHATGSGALGWGLGAAVGVSLADRGTRVHAVVSDGVFQFGVQALRTAVAEDVPVTWIVLNNRSYHAVRLALRNYGGAAARSDSYPCTDLGDTDIAALGRAFGAHGHRVTTLDDLPDALATAADRSGPAVIEVLVDTGSANPVR